MMTNWAFGGRDGKTLYITAGHKLWSVPVDSPGFTQWPKRSIGIRQFTSPITRVKSVAQLAHHVFFKLKDNSEQAVEHMLAECRKYLDNHDGLVGFSVGVRDPELNREVNHDFDVSLHCIFADRPAHDTYQTAPRHLEFIEANKENWAEVRVCDSTIQ